MAWKKNNKRNCRKTIYYHINQFDYKAKKKLTEGQLLLKKTYSSEKVKVV